MKPEVREFVEDLVKVYEKHGLSLGHEDYQGAFIVEDFSQHNVEWLYGALDKREGNAPNPNTKRKDQQPS